MERAICCGAHTSPRYIIQLETMIRIRYMWFWKKYSDECSYKKTKCYRKNHVSHNNLTKSKNIKSRHHDHHLPAWSRLFSPFIYIQTVNIYEFWLWFCACGCDNEDESIFNTNHSIQSITKDFQKVRMMTRF